MLRNSLHDTHGNEMKQLNSTTDFGLHQLVEPGNRQY